MSDVIQALLGDVLDNLDSPRQVQILDGAESLTFVISPDTPRSGGTTAPPQELDTPGFSPFVSTRDITFVEAGFRVVRGETILWDGGHEVIAAGVTYVFKRDFTICLRLKWVVYRHVWEAMEAEARRYTESKGERARLLRMLKAYCEKPRPTAWQRLLEGEDD